MTSGSKVAATSTTAKARQGDDKKDGVPQPKSMSRGKVWSEEIEDGNIDENFNVLACLLIGASNQGGFTRELG